MRKAFLFFMILFPSILACSSAKPPDALFQDNIRKMVLIDRAMGFDEEITDITIVKKTPFENQVEVTVRVEGWATHKDLVIGAALPASKVKKPGWAIWKFFCRKKDKVWVIMEKYKVEEGFDQ